MKSDAPGKSESAPVEAESSSAYALYKQATEVAHVCREIVLACVIVLDERRFVRVEGWMAIAAAFGCVPSTRDVEQVPGDGVRCIADLVRLEDLRVIASAEGFVGFDEPDWFGGEVKRLNKKKRPPAEEVRTVPKRLDHAIRAMAQTRGISRVLRQVYSHVIVMIDKDLSTVPAEEIEALSRDREDDDDTDRPSRPDRLSIETKEREKEPPAPAAREKEKATTAASVPREPSVELRDQFRDHKWETVKIHFGQANKGKTLGELSPKSLRYWVNEWQPRQIGNRPIPPEDHALRAALDVAGEETEAEGSK